MDTIDLDSIEEDCIPNGKYLSEIADIEQKQTRKGDRMWSVRFRIADGLHEGTFVFDNMVFVAGPGLRRFKMLCEALGLGAKVELDPALFQAKRVVIDVVIDDDPDWGRRNKITFRGFSSADSYVAITGPSEADDADSPF